MANKKQLPTTPEFLLKDNNDKNKPNDTNIIKEGLNQEYEAYMEELIYLYKASKKQ